MRSFSIITRAGKWPHILVYFISVADAPPNYHALFAQSVFRMMDLTSEIVGQSNENEERSCCSQLITYMFLSGNSVFQSAVFNGFLHL